MKFFLVALPIPIFGQLAHSHLQGYQRACADAGLHPKREKLAMGYNIIQSTIALRSGGMQTNGLLKGTQRHLDFSPAEQTDFIFTMIGKAFGFATGFAVIGLLCLIILGGMLIAPRCRQQFGQLVTIGISCNFFLHVFVNIAMVMGVIPTGCAPLPLVSHRGTTMLTVMARFGVLMSVHVHRDLSFALTDEEG